jgi:hypothetical protein
VRKTHEPLSHSFTYRLYARSLLATTDRRPHSIQICLPSPLRDHHGAISHQFLGVYYFSRQQDLGDSVVCAAASCLFLVSAISLLPPSTSQLYKARPQALKNSLKLNSNVLARIYQHGPSSDFQVHGLRRSPVRRTHIRRTLVTHCKLGRREGAL